MDLEDIPLDFRYLDLLLRASRDPEVALGSFAGGGPRRTGNKTAKKTQTTTERRSSRETRPRWQHLETRSKTFWDDQSRRGRVPKITGHKARKQSPDLVVAALGQTEKTSPTRSYHHAYSSTGPTAWIRDQERAPVAADLKRVMREDGEARRKDFRVDCRRGTCWVAKLRLEATRTSTESEPSESPRLRTTGQGQPRRSAD